MTLRDPKEYVVVQTRAYFAHFSSTLWTLYSIQGDSNQSDLNIKGDYIQSLWHHVGVIIATGIRVHRNCGGLYELAHHDIGKR